MAAAGFSAGSSEGHDCAYSGWMPRHASGESVSPPGLGTVREEAGLEETRRTVEDAIRVGARGAGTLPAALPLLAAQAS